MPKKGSKAFQYMTPTEVEGYQEYTRRHRSGKPQDTETRTGNSAYAKAMKTVRQQTQRVQRAED